MSRGRRAQARNPVGEALTIRRAELNLARNQFRWRYRLEQIEGTSKLTRATKLAGLEGSEEFLEPLGFTLEDLQKLAAGKLNLEDVLEAARRRSHG